MGKKGGQPGNNNALRGKQWRDAVRKAVMRDGNLEALARKLVEMALDGDIWAIREIGDRLDGKPVQALEHNTNPVASQIEQLSPEAQDQLLEQLTAIAESEEPPVH